MKTWGFIITLLPAMALAANCEAPPPFQPLATQKQTVFLEKAKQWQAFLPQQPSSVLLYNFWATWCAPCRQELPLLQQLNDEGRASVVLVNIEDSPAEAQKLLDSLQVKLKTTYSDADLLDALGLNGLPATVVAVNTNKAEANQTDPSQANTSQANAGLFVSIGVLKQEDKLRDWLKCLSF